MASPQEIIRALFTAFAAQDRETAERLLGPEFRFTSPYDDYIDRAAGF